MWIVRLALRRPYTFVVAALLLLLMTPFVITKTPTDIFPAINILAMKKLIILATGLSVSAMIVVSCASESTTTTAATTRQSMQPMGYRDNHMENFYPAYWDALP